MFHFLKNISLKFTEIWKSLALLRNPVRWSKKIIWALWYHPVSTQLMFEKRISVLWSTSINKGSFQLIINFDIFEIKSYQGPLKWIRCCMEVILLKIVLFKTGYILNNIPFFFWFGWLSVLSIFIDKNHHHSTVFAWKTLWKGCVKLESNVPSGFELN